MSGIPVHTASPINANTPTKASGITPSTSAAGSRYTPSSEDASISSPTRGLDTSQKARPGATPALPQPTGGIPSQYSAVPPPTRTTNEQSSSTTANPPPPQPGALPSRYTPQSQQTHQPASPQPSNALPPPLPEHQQFPNMKSTPTRAQPVAGTTTTTAPHEYQQQQQPRDLSHPPGYIQDSSSFQSRIPFDQDQQSTSTMATSSTGRGQGLLDRDPTSYMANNFSDGRGHEGEEKGIWDTAVTWAYAAGKKLSEGEEKVWKTINGEK